MPKCTVSGDEPMNALDASVPNDAKRPDGQHVDHWVMCRGEIIEKGFVRPVRMKYVHVGIKGPVHPTRPLTDEETERWGGNGYVAYEEYPEDKRGLNGRSLGRFWKRAELDKVGRGCGTVTSMPRSIAETYAAQPGYYGKTYCAGCCDYHRVGIQGEFVWDGTDDRVGT